MKDMTDHIAEKVIDILATQARVDPGSVSLSASLESLGIDSLGMVEAIFAIEETFDVSVPFNANAPAGQSVDLSRVDKVIDAVHALVAQQNA